MPKRVADCRTRAGAIGPCTKRRRYWTKRQSRWLVEAACQRCQHFAACRIQQCWKRCQVYIARRLCDSLRSLNAAGLRPNCWCRTTAGLLHSRNCSCRTTAGITLLLGLLPIARATLGLHRAQGLQAPQVQPCRAVQRPQDSLTQCVDCHRTHWTARRACCNRLQCICPN